tara:strand:- start:182 stop:1303 length:1122 start_codon:yes stop_codon:yes gene_type:complete
MEKQERNQSQKFKKRNFFNIDIKNIYFPKLDNRRKKFLETINKLTKQKLDLLTANSSILLHKLQDKTELLLRNDSNHIILRQSKFWASSIAWALMGGSAFAIGWISTAKTDEVVIAFGKLEPKGGVVEVQMPVEGIAKEILVKEGEKVSKGQILIRLDTEITEATNEALQKNLEINNLITQKLSSLVQEGAVSELQYLQQKAKVEDIKNRMTSNLVKLRYQEIKSPINGVIFELVPKGRGYVARTSQPVLKIVPTSNLIAKIEIDSRTIGFVSTGKNTDISIDSFPATDFGVISGTVTRIGSDALAPIPSEGKGYRFPAEVTLNDQYLELKSGKRLPLQAGMSLTANIKLRKVTYLQLLLNKFGDKADSLKSI